MNHWQAGRIALSVCAGVDGVGHWLVEDADLNHEWTRIFTNRLRGFGLFC